MSFYTYTLGLVRCYWIVIDGVLVEVRGIEPLNHYNPLQSS